MDSFHLSTGEFGVSFCEASRDSEGWLDSFVVRIGEPGLSAEARVENSSFIHGPEVFFSEMAQSWRGWSGEKTWHALEGELALAATTDSCGHVTIEVQLRPDTGPGAWRVVSYAYLEAGQLDAFAARATKFFGRST